MELAKDFDAFKLESNPPGSDPVDKTTVAYHEAGHVVCAWYLTSTQQPSKVTIVPSGNVLGQTEYSGASKSSSSRDVADHTTVALAGMAAEYLFLNKISPGNQRDLFKAAETAWIMVQVMSQSPYIALPLTDLIRILVMLEYDFLREVPLQPDRTVIHNWQHASTVLGLLLQGFGEALTVLKRHKDEVEKVAQKLLQEETLTAADIVKLLGKRPTTREIVSSEGTPTAQKFARLDFAQKTKYNTAYHLAGHVVSAWFLQEDGVPFKVTCNPSDGEDGSMEVVLVDAKIEEPRRVKERLGTVIGGVVAETLLLNTICNNKNLLDMRRAAYKAYKRVWITSGNAEDFKEADFMSKISMPFTTTGEPVEEDKALAGVVIGLIFEAYGRVFEFMEGNREHVQKVANRLLLRQGTITEKEIRKLLGDRPFPQYPRPKIDYTPQSENFRYFL